jgi:hypothetical protein
VKEVALAGAQVVVGCQSALDLLGDELCLALRLVEVGEHPPSPPTVVVVGEGVADFPARDAFVNRNSY